MAAVIPAPVPPTSQDAHDALVLCLYAERDGNEVIHNDLVVLKNLSGGQGNHNPNESLDQARAKRLQPFRRAFILNWFATNTIHPTEIVPNPLGAGHPNLPLQVPVLERVPVDFTRERNVILLALRQAICDNRPGVRDGALGTANGPLEFTYDERRKIANALNALSQAELNQAVADLNTFIAAPVGGPAGVFDAETCTHFRTLRMDGVPTAPVPGAQDAFVAGRVFDLGPDPAAIVNLANTAMRQANDSAADVTSCQQVLADATQIGRVCTTAQRQAELASGFVTQAHQGATRAMNVATQVDTHAREVRRLSQRGQGSAAGNLMNGYLNADGKLQSECAAIKDNTQQLRAKVQQAHDNAFAEADPARKLKDIEKIVDRLVVMAAAASNWYETSKAIVECNIPDVPIVAGHKKVGRTIVNGINEQLKIITRAVNMYKVDKDGKDSKAANLLPMLRLHRDQKTAADRAIAQIGPRRAAGNAPEWNVIVDNAKAVHVGLEHAKDYLKAAEVALPLTEAKYRIIVRDVKGKADVVLGRATQSIPSTVPPTPTMAPLVFTPANVVNPNASATAQQVALRRIK